MTKPLVVVFPHQLGKAEAHRRLDAGLQQLSGLFGAKLSSFEHSWSGDQLAVKLGLMGQSVSGIIDVAEDQVRIEVTLPWVLAIMAEKVRGLVQSHGTTLLEKK